MQRNVSRHDQSGNMFGIEQEYTEHTRRRHDSHQRPIVTGEELNRQRTLMVVVNAGTGSATLWKARAANTFSFQTRVRISEVAW